VNQGSVVTTAPTGDRSYRVCKKVSLSLSLDQIW